MSRATSHAALRWGGWILAAALAVALWSHRSALDRANHRLDRLAPLAERTSVRDRLIGTDLAGLRFSGPEGREDVTVPGDGRTLVWLVDPRECANCMSDRTRWREFSDGRISVTTVLVGVTPEEAARIRANVDLPGRVAVDPHGERAATLGVSEELPSLYLVLDSEGIVLMTEGRRSATSCDWSFTEQVAAMTTGRARGAVRPGDVGP